MKVNANAGEIASKMAVDVLRDYIARTTTGGEVLVGGHNREYSDAANRLASGIRLAMPTSVYVGSWAQTV